MLAGGRQVQRDVKAKRAKARDMDGERAHPMRPALVRGIVPMSDSNALLMRVLFAVRLRVRLPDAQPRPNQRGQIKAGVGCVDEK